MFHHMVFVVIVGYVHSQNLGLSFTLSNTGMKFLPMNTIQLLDTITTSSLKQCAFTCGMLVSYCRAFEYDSSALQCRLVEGDSTTGQIVPSASSSNSIVGTINLIPELFTAYNQSCSQCVNNHFLTCINSTCQCISHSYFDGVMCQLQKFINATCNSTNECRSDLNLTCLQTSQCGRK